LLIIFSIHSGLNSSSSEDTGFYEENLYTGGEDFVDPQQEPETFGPTLPSFRNGASLAEASNQDFAADVGARIAEYVSVEIPNEKEVYMLDRSLIVDGNRYSFTVEAGESKQQISIEAFKTRQGFANVYFDGDGPYSFSYPYPSR
jgi:hypothetical protein